MVIPTNFRLRSDAPILCGLAFVAPLIAAVAPLQISMAAVAAALAVALRRSLNRGPWPLSQPRLVTILVGVVVWATASTMWAIDTSLSIGTAARLLIAAATLIILADAAARLNLGELASFRRWMSYGAIVGLILTLLIIATIYAYTIWIQGAEMAEHRLAALNRSASVIAILMWPWTLGIAQDYGRYAAASFIAAAAATVFFLPPLAPLIALIIGACAFAVAWRSPLLAKVLLLVVFTILILMVPFLDNVAPLAIEFLLANLHDHVPAVHRFVIWQFAAEHILEHPIFGWGLDAARVFPGGDAELLLLTTPKGGLITGPALPLHTHNALIQIWLELGIVGVALFATLLALAVRGIPHLPGDRAGSAVALAAMTTAFVIAQLGFGFWQGWWLATLGISAVITIAVVGHPGSIYEPEPGRQPPTSHS